MRWALVHKVTASSPGRVLLVLEGVPESRGHDEVMAALSTWREFPSYKAGIGETLELEQRPAKGIVKGASKATAGVDWAALVPDRRKITTDIPGDVAVLCRRSARAAGLTLGKWAEKVLTEGAGARWSE